ncbi:MAG: glycosyltransferase [Nitrospira sp.]
MKSEILFFVPEWPALDSPILHAQVLSVAAFLRQQGFACRFVGAETSRTRAMEAKTLIEKEYDVPAHVVHALEPNARAQRLWMACFKVYRAMCVELRETTLTHVYARSFIGAFWARKLARKFGALSIFDVRAVVGQEQQLEHGSGIKAAICSFFELRESRSADRLSTVSNNLKQHLSLEAGRHDIAVIPSCVNEHSFHFDAVARKEIRQSLGLNDNDILLCYSGGISAWQRLSDIILLLKGVCSNNVKCKALFLTTNTSELTRRLKEVQFPVDMGFVRGCSHMEVHRFLSAADIGILMRHDIPVNNVASPVKVGEYLVCGLPVILTRGIGDYSDMLPNAGVGLLLDEAGDMVEQVLAFINRCDLQIQKSRAMQFAKARLTMSANLDQYRSLYAKI